LADGRLRQVEPLRGAMEAPALATATKARNNSKFSMQLILFFDQSYYKISFLQSMMSSYLPLQGQD
jgi:hypothetical protein